MVLSDMLFNTTEDIMPPMTVFNKVLVHCKHFNIFMKVYSMTLMLPGIYVHFVHLTPLPK